MFLWIPRAHAFALHEIETEVTLPSTGEVVTAMVEMPLAWAVAKSWGFDSYSTAFVWTKTDEHHPEEAGGAVLVRDHDELLLRFKRGRGLPKPDTGEKFGSNHRERSRPLGHSTKPQHYRRMIATMAGGGVPVLELFARVDADNPPPLCWDLWGNQARTSAATEIADGGERSRPADQPAPPVQGLPADGRVDAAANDSRAAAAVPPADRPGCNSKANTNESPAQKAVAEPAGIKPSASRVVDGRTSDSVVAQAAAPLRLPLEPHPLDIPAFLRRPLKQAEMDLTRRDRAPPEIVDGALQTRLPLTEDELRLHAALTSVAAGHNVDGSIVRDLVGAGFVHATTEHLMVTEEGRTFLAQLVTPAALEAVA